MRSVMIVTPAVLALCAANVQAQYRNPEPSESQSEASPQRQTSGQRETSAQRNPSTSQSAQRAGQARLVPQGWIRVWSDYNNDGRYDAVETIYSYDLQVARERSQARRSGQQPQDARSSQASRQQPQDMRSSQASRQQPSQTTRVSGRLTSKRSVDLIGESGKQTVLGKVQTSDNKTVSVILGRGRELTRLDLQEGDRIEVEGIKSRLNDQPFVLARRVSAGGETVSTSLPQRPQVRKIEGTVTSLRKANFRGQEEAFLVATIRAQDGRQRQVNLGPEQKLTKLDLQQGDRSRFWRAPRGSTDSPRQRPWSSGRMTRRPCSAARSQADRPPPTKDRGSANSPGVRPGHAAGFRLVRGTVESRRPRTSKPALRAFLWFAPAVGHL